jgi:hypothetical protein
MLTAKARNARKRSDRRYGSQRWRKLAKEIVKRDVWCYVPDCPFPARLADHVWPTTIDTPDVDFFNRLGLRGSCWGHNRIRSWGIGVGDADSKPRPSTFPRPKPRVG